MASFLYSVLDLSDDQRRQKTSLAQLIIQKLSDKTRRLPGAMYRTHSILRCRSGADVVSGRKGVEAIAPVNGSTRVRSGSRDHPHAITICTSAHFIIFLSSLRPEHMAAPANGAKMSRRADTNTSMRAQSGRLWFANGLLSHGQWVLSLKLLVVSRVKKANMSAAAHASAEGVPRHTFGTADVEPQHQFDAWLSIMQPFVSMDPRSPPQNGFLARAVVWDLGPLALARVTMPAIEFRRDAAGFRADSVDHWTLDAPKSGILTSGSGDSTAAGLCHVRALHRMSVGSNTQLDIVSLFVPRDFSPSNANQLDLLHDRNIRSGWGGLLADYFHSLERQLPTLHREHLPSVVEATRALVVACTTPGKDTLAEAMSAIQVTQAERAKQFVRQNLLSPRLGAKELCRQLSMSRSSLYRLFEPFGGVVQYIRSARLMDAHRILSNSVDTRPIHVVAAERGFLDPSEFSRAFRRHFGYSPSEARHEGRRPAARKHTDRDVSTASFGELVAQFTGHAVRVRRPPQVG